MRVPDGYVACTCLNDFWISGYDSYRSQSRLSCFDLLDGFNTYASDMSVLTLMAAAIAAVGGRSMAKAELTSFAELCIFRKVLLTCPPWQGRFSCWASLATRRTTTSLLHTCAGRAMLASASKMRRRRVGHSWTLVQSWILICLPVAWISGLGHVLCCPDSGHCVRLHARHGAEAGHARTGVDTAGGQQLPWQSALSKFSTGFNFSRLPHLDLPVEWVDVLSW